MPLAAVAAIGAVGSIAGAAISSSAAGNAASTQASAALQAAQLQHQDAQAALGFTQQQWNTQQQELAPWLGAGQAGLANLENLLGLPVTGNMYMPGQQAQVNAAGGNMLPGGASFGVGSGVGPTANPANWQGKGVEPVVRGGVGGGTAAGGGVPLSSLINPALGAAGSLNQPFPGGQFVAPTNITEQNDPGYQARLNLGQQAIERSAAAQGGLLSGGTGRALDRYAQDYASNEYGNVYNRRFNEYATNYNQWLTGNQNLYNRLAGMAGVGQTAASQLGYLGQGAANNISNTLMTSGAQIGNQLNNAAAAQASGYVGSANAWSGALGGLGNNLMGAYLLNSLMKPAATTPYGLTSPYTVEADINSLPNLCWIARAIYGENDPRWLKARTRMLDWARVSPEGARFVAWYEKHGEAASQVPEVVEALRPFFDRMIA